MWGAHLFLYFPVTVTLKVTVTQLLIHGDEFIACFVNRPSERLFCYLRFVIVNFCFTYLHIIHDDTWNLAEFLFHVHHAMSARHSLNFQLLGFHSDTSWLDSVGLFDYMNIHHP